MKVVILGANGKTGRQLLEQAMAAGHTVTVVVRRPDALQDFDGMAGIRVIVGDACDVTFLTAATAGQEVLISSLGPSRKSPDLSLGRRSTQAIITACTTNGITRVIILTTFLAKEKQLGFLPKLLMKTPIGKAIKDAQSIEPLLRASRLNWTLVYATVLTNNPARQSASTLPATKTLGFKHKISRHAVAGYMLTSITDTALYKAEVTIVGN